MYWGMGKLRIWSHLLKKSLMENIMFCAVLTELFSIKFEGIKTQNKMYLFFRFEDYIINDLS